MTQQATRTTCPYCGVGCGIIVNRETDGAIAVRGDPDHPANFGRLCSKGAALAETLDLDGRLLYPEMDGQRVHWETALDAVADGLQQTIDQHGRDSVAFYVSGQMLTEDYYVANKLMKGFLGSGNIDTNSRLCMSSSVVGHQRAFGEDIVPGNYEDLEQADLIVLVGSNLAWCHPVLYQRLVQARRQRDNCPKVIVIDPRSTVTCDIADLHLPIRPGTDTTLFNGLLVQLHQQEKFDPEFLEERVSGYWNAYRAARENAPNMPAVAQTCGLSLDDVAEFYNHFCRTEKVVTVYSQGVNQSSFGTDKVNAIINCHLATGRIGRPGMGAFSVTGQPNAMGGREVGGLATQLAAHMDFAPENVERVQRFWQIDSEIATQPCVADQPGLKAVDLFQAVADGKIKALWIIATNPVVSLPNADAVRAALEKCPLVIVSDANRNNDTARLAHIRLPALTWGERDGTVTNSERCISRQRSFLPAPSEAKADWWILCEVARRLGFSAAFDYTRSAEIFREHAALSAFENDGQRIFNLGGLRELNNADYDALEPVQWPVLSGERQGTARLFDDGHFATADGRARMLPISNSYPAHSPTEDFPFTLNTGRVRDHWHTLTRTGKSPRLSAHIGEPYAELNIQDALALGIAESALVRVHSQWGEAVLRARLSESQQHANLFAPMHWGSPQARLGRINAVVNPVTDPLSGQPESKQTPVRVQTWAAAWHGFLLSREGLPTEGLELADYQVTIRGKDYWRLELAGELAPDGWSDWAKVLLGDAGEWLEFLDPGTGRYRAALLQDGRLSACLFTAPTHQLPPRDWLGRLFAQDTLDQAERNSLLAGRPLSGKADCGRLVCSCFGVGLNTLNAAIREQGLTTPEAVGATLRAGTNCGSCVPELRQIIAQNQPTSVD